MQQAGNRKEGFLSLGNALRYPSSASLILSKPLKLSSPGEPGEDAFESLLDNRRVAKGEQTNRLRAEGKAEQRRSGIKAEKIEKPGQILFQEPGMFKLVAGLPSTLMRKLWMPLVKSYGVYRGQSGKTHVRSPRANRAKPLDGYTSKQSNGFPVWKLRPRSIAS